MDESFSLDDLHRLEIEEALQIPNKDDITVCSCNGICLKDKGRMHAVAKLSVSIAHPPAMIAWLKICA